MNKPASGTHLRSVKQDDATAQALLHWLQLEILPSDTPADTTTGYWWVLEDQCRPIGFAGLQASTKYLGVGYLCRAGVVKDWRGKGLQKRLIRVRVNKAKALGWQWLMTDTYNNPASANSLIACGFQTFTPSQPWGMDGAIYWRKRLTTTYK